MIKKLLLALLLFNCSLTYAQTIKTDILVIGGDAGGTAAAIQGARSKLKTLLIESGVQICPAMVSQSMVTITKGMDLPSGIWGEFRKRTIEFYKKTPGYDTAYNINLQLEPYTGSAIFKKIADTVKNLTVKLNTSFSTVKRNGDVWEVTISQNGKSQLVKAKVIIDATQGATVAAKLGITVKPFDFGAGNQRSTLYRTSIAMGDSFPGQGADGAAPAGNYPPYPSYCIPLNSIVVKQVDNLLVTAALIPGGDIQYLASQLTLGQGAGTAAAFCAFFKTTTKKLDPRTVQGEILDFKGYLLPFADVKPNDPYMRAIQQVGATGLLKGLPHTASNGVTQLFFMPDSVVNTAEVKPLIMEIYTRAFLWFNKEKPGDKFTVGNLMSFISEITLTEPKTLQISLQKNWKTEYKFTTNFDMARPVTRREFAVLANKFLNPFARLADLNGNMVN